MVTQLMGKECTGKQNVWSRICEKKTINDAKDYIKRASVKSKVIGYIVGSNDLTFKSAEDAAQDAKDLISQTKTRFPESEVIFYEVPPRKSDPRWKGYENRRNLFNHMIAKYCDNMPGSRFVSSSITEHDISNDNVHLWKGSERIIVRDLKFVMNKLLGLKAYEEYRRDENTTSNNMRYSSNNVKWAKNDNQRDIYQNQFNNSVEYRRQTAYPTERHQEQYTRQNINSTGYGEWRQPRVNDDKQYRNHSRHSQGHRYQYNGHSKGNNIDKTSNVLSQIFELIDQIKQQV